MPDYAAAGTLGDNCTTTAIRVGWVDGPPAGAADCWAARTPNCSGQTVAGPLSGPFGTYGSSDAGPRLQATSAIPSTPTGPAGNLSVEIDGYADGNGAFDATINWSVDPPFNRCQLTNATGTVRGPGNFFGTGPAPYTQNNASAFISTAHNSTNGNGTANMSFTGTSPGGAQQGRDVILYISCDGPGNISC